MTKQTALKNVIWAICIGLALLALLIGLFIVAVEHYYGDRERPVMNIGSTAAVSSAKASPDAVGAGQGTQADGKLHELKSSRDAGQSYLDSLCFLCDSSCAPLQNSGLVGGQVWLGEDRRLPMTTAFSWRIIFPSDGSVITPDTAAMIAKPGILVIAVGSDDAGSISREDFIENYETLISSILTASPGTLVICGSLCSVTTAYAGDDGLTGERAAELNDWIKQVCIDTGAYYADWSSALTGGGYLRPEYAESNGRTLSAAGLNALLGWLRSHASA